MTMYSSTAKRGNCLWRKMSTKSCHQVWAKKYQYLAAGGAVNQNIQKSTTTPTAIPTIRRNRLSSGWAIWNALDRAAKNRKTAKNQNTVPMMACRHCPHGVSYSGPFPTTPNGMT
mmetsp:Transcript_64459/g.135239  ORF Transcript_64459/g.135239 Transcript_64459/m.135239 type:complete len:115 (-) Transcript_64459:14-358(-)